MKYTNAKLKDQPLWNTGIQRNTITPEGLNRQTRPTGFIILLKQAKGPNNNNISIKNNLKYLMPMD